jgi:hypothetical protein
MINIVKQIKKINTKTLIKFFYMMCMLNFILNKKLNCFIISIATTLILFFIVKKDINISMLLSLILSIFVFSCNKVFEYNEDGKETGDDIADIESDDVSEDTPADVSEGTTDGVDAEKLANAIANATATGLILPKGNLEEQRKKARKAMNNRLLRCQTGTLKPIDKCIEERNSRMMGEEVSSDTITTTDTVP